MFKHTSHHNIMYITPSMHTIYYSSTVLNFTDYLGTYSQSERHSYFFFSGKTLILSVTNNNLILSLRLTTTAAGLES